MIRWSHSSHIGQYMMQLTLTLAITCNIGRYTIHQSFSKEVEGCHSGKFSSLAYPDIIIPRGDAISFSQKKNGGLWCSIEYCVLNLAIVKISYRIPLISNIPDSVHMVQMLKMLHLNIADDIIQRQGDDEHCMELWMNCGQFKYQVMGVILTNPFNTFQSLINDCL